MNRFLAAQEEIAAVLKAHPGFPAQLDIIARREKDIASEIESKLGKLGICLWVMPPLPKSAIRTQNEIVFFDRVECRIRIIEQPQLNSSKFGAWDAMEQVIVALQGINPNDIFAVPLGLSERPVDLIEDKTTRVFDIDFETAFQLND